MCRFILVFFFLFTVFAVPFGQAQQKLKVITYNIWVGFDHGKDEQRKQSTAEWLAAQDADVVALQELNDFTQSSLEDFAKSYGHEYAVILKEDGFPIGLTSKRPIALKTKMLGGMWHGMLHVSTFDIDFLVVHLSPQDWKFRHREADIICDYLENSIVKTGQKSFVVLGDFNAHSPYDVSLDQANPDNFAFHQNHDKERYDQKGEEALQTLRNGRYDYSVMAKFISFPLADVVEKYIPTPNRFSFPSPIIQEDPKLMRMDGRHCRLDYIMVSPYLDARCVSADVVNAEATTRLSDHYPVVAEFLLED